MSFPGVSADGAAATAAAADYDPARRQDSVSGGAIVMPVHAWHRLCESVSSRSAICPRPGSLIREESCGKVCVSLHGGPLLSLQLFVSEGGGGGGVGVGCRTSGLGVSHSRKLTL